VTATLGSLGPVVVPAMRELLRSGQPPLMYYGAQVLHMLGEAAAEAMPELLDILLNGTDYNARQMAAAALCQMGPAPADVVPRLAALAKEREPLWRGYAAYVLARMGRAAQPTLPALERLLEDGDATVRHAAIQALAQLAGELPDALPPLRRPFQDADPERRKQALEALQQLATDVLVRPHIYPLIQSHLSDAAPAVRYTAWACVGAVVRSLAAVGRKTGTGPSFNDLLTILRRNLHDPDPEMRNTAAYQIGQLREAAADAVPELTELLGDPRSVCAAVMALGNIGRPAASALPILRGLARNVQTYEGQRAGTAVERIEGRTG
jgi:HEAT repeat protein